MAVAADTDPHSTRLLSGFLASLQEPRTPYVSPNRVAAALGVLSRHYNPDSGHERRPRQTLHWGATDYRPSIT